MCVAALEVFLLAHVENRYEAIDDTREDSQYEQYVVQYSSCLLVRLVDDVVQRTQYHVQAASQHLQHKGRVSALPPVAPVCNFNGGQCSLFAGNPQSSDSQPGFRGTLGYREM